MPDIERTRAGFQAVIPGCEHRTLPKSTTAADASGQGLLDFYRQPTLRETLTALADAPLKPRRRLRRAGRRPQDTAAGRTASDIINQNLPRHLQLEA